VPEYVVVQERYYRDPPRWQRKVGDGNWEDMPLINGQLPVVFYESTGGLDDAEKVGD
jgi:hypothetical protein